MATLQGCAKNEPDACAGVSAVWEKSEKAVWFGTRPWWSDNGEKTALFASTVVLLQYWRKCGKDPDSAFSPSGSGSLSKYSVETSE